MFNNESKPVKKFKPFFDTTRNVKLDYKVSVSSTLLYDPLSRTVATINPNRTWGKVVFTPWKQITFDANNTIAIIMHARQYKWMQVRSEARQMIATQALVV